MRATGLWPDRMQKERICSLGVGFCFLDGMYRLYAKQPNPIGCPLGHAAGDSDGASAVMKEKALKTLQRITSLFDEAFRDFGDAPGLARV